MGNRRTAEKRKRAMVFINENNIYHNKLMGIQPKHMDFLKPCQNIYSRFNCFRKKTISYNFIPTLLDGEKGIIHT